MTDATKMSISYACQRCLQPLTLDESFNCLGEHILAELSCKFEYSPFCCMCCHFLLLQYPSIQIQKLI